MTGPNRARSASAVHSGEARRNRSRCGERVAGSGYRVGNRNTRGVFLSR